MLMPPLAEAHMHQINEHVKSKRKDHDAAKCAKEIYMNQKFQ